MTVDVVSYLPLWRRYLDQFDPDLMSFEEMGRLVYAMMRFHFLDEEPTELPLQLKLCWSFLRNDMIFAKNAYLTASKNGKKGGRPKKSKTENNPEESQQNPDESQNNLNESQPNPEKPITESITITEAITESISNTNTDTDSGSAPSLPEGGEGICCKKKAFGEFGWVKLTEQQHERLMQEWGSKELLACITYIDEAAQSTQNKNRWKDWYLVLRRCHQNSWHHPTRSKADPIPKGASGELGEAELEAIQRVLRE